MRHALVILSGPWVLASPAVDADTFHVVPTIGILETLTNNVGLTASGSKQGDLVSQLTPGLQINETGPRSSLTGSIAVPIVLYARTGAENNQVYAQANLTGTVEAVEKFFFIDSSVSVSQQYLTPFGAQPSGLANQTANRYTAESYTVDPYIKGVTQGGVNYELRDRNYWTVVSGTSVPLNNSYSNEIVGRLTRDPAPFGWALDYDRTSVTFNTQSPLITQLGRLRILHQPDPEVQLNASGGYENNDYALSHYRGSIYGVGGIWHPTDRTNLEASWEHRFFGASYLFNLTHRTPLSVWSLNASRNITTYPQQLLALPAGFNVASLLSQLFLSSIPDPVQRQTFVNQFINDHGLPTFLSSPVSLYSQQITLQEQANASLGLLGARNSIFFGIFYLRSQPITAAGNELPGFIGALTRTKQVGVGANWTNTLAPRLTFALNAVVTRAESDVPQSALGGIGTTNQGYVNATLSSTLSPNTTVNGGVSYQVQHVDMGTGYNAASVFVGLNHTFH